MYSQLKSQRLFALSFLVLYVFQNEVVYPIEAAVRTDDFASVASFVYLPHGLKVFCALSIGLWSLPLIFIAQTFNTIYFTGSFDMAMLSSSILAMASVGLPVYLFNRSLKQPIMTSPFATNIILFSSFWLFITFAIVTAMLNSFMQPLVYGLPNTSLPWYFLVGDIVGSAAFFIVATALFELTNYFRHQR